MKSLILSAATLALGWRCRSGERRTGQEALAHLPRGQGHQDHRPTYAERRQDTPAEGCRGKLVEKVKKGGFGVWGRSRCRQRRRPDADVKALVKWVLSVK